MYYVYILQSSKDKKTYTGYTKNLNVRLSLHNGGRVLATKYRRPLELLLSEDFETLEEAKKRELWWKRSSGRKRLKKLFE